MNSNTQHNARNVNGKNFGDPYLKSLSEEILSLRPGNNSAYYYLMMHFFEHQKYDKVIASFDEIQTANRGFEVRHIYAKSQLSDAKKLFYGIEAYLYKAVWGFIDADTLGLLRLIPGFHWFLLLLALTIWLCIYRDLGKEREFICRALFWRKTSLKRHK